MYCRFVWFVVVLLPIWPICKVNWTHLRIYLLLKRGLLTHTHTQQRTKQTIEYKLTSDNVRWEFCVGMMVYQIWLEDKLSSKNMCNFFFSCRHLIVKNSDNRVSSLLLMLSNFKNVYSVLFWLLCLGVLFVKVLYSTNICSWRNRDMRECVFISESIVQMEFYS